MHLLLFRCYWRKFVFFFVSAKSSAQPRLMKSKSSKKRNEWCVCVCVPQFSNCNRHQHIQYVCVCVYCTSDRWVADDDLLNCEIAIYKLDMCVLSIGHKNTQTHTGCDDRCFLQSIICNFFSLSLILTQIRPVKVSAYSQ